MEELILSFSNVITFVSMLASCVPDWVYVALQWFFSGFLAIVTGKVFLEVVS